MDVVMTFAGAAAAHALLGGAQGRLTAPAGPADDEASGAGVLESEPSHG